MGSRSSFSGTPGQSSVSTAAKNAILYGICFAVLIAALLVINHVKRRR